MDEIYDFLQSLGELAKKYWWQMLLLFSLGLVYGVVVLVQRYAIK